MHTIDARLFFLSYFIEYCSILYTRRNPHRSGYTYNTNAICIYQFLLWSRTLARGWWQLWTHLLSHIKVAKHVPHRPLATHPTSHYVIIKYLFPCLVFIYPIHTKNILSWDYVILSFRDEWRPTLNLDTCALGQQLRKKGLALAPNWGQDSSRKI